MASNSSILLLFPSDPIGKGSTLAFRTAIGNNKPVFVVTHHKPDESSLYMIYSSSLFGVVSGYWCIPNIYLNTGSCNELKYNPAAA
jgi:hypothetical protein